MLRSTALGAALALAFACTAGPALADPPFPVLRAVPLGDPRLSVANEAPWLAQPASRPFTILTELGFDGTVAADVWTSCATDGLPGVSEAGAGGLLGPHPKCRDHIAYGFAEAGAHAFVTYALKHCFHAQNVLIGGWQLGTGGAEIAASLSNASLLHHH